MNLQQLKYIVEIAKVGSITKAAEKLYMNQPNLSRSIIEFEKEFGITIFNRTSQGVILTNEGKILVEQAEEILSKTNSLEKALFDSNKSKLNFKISVPRASYISSSFCDTIKELSSQKQLNIEFKESNNLEVINDVTLNGFNMGIIRIPVETEAKFKKLFIAKKLSFQEIWNFKYKIVLSNNHPLAKKEKVCFDDLKPYSVLIHDDEYVPFISKDEIKKHILSYDSDSRILIQERGSQFDILSSLDTTYMWVSPIPEKLLIKHNLSMKTCEDNDQLFIDLLIYRTENKLSDFEKSFVKNVLNMRYQLDE